MKLRDIANNVLVQLQESGIQLPKNTKAVKIIHHKDMDGVFSAIIAYNQILRQGISPRNITLHTIQYGDEQRDKNELVNKFKRSKGQAVVLVDFARLPSGIDEPDFWSDHHAYEGDKPKVSGRVGATEYKSDASHLALIRTSNMVDKETLKAIDIVDSAGYSNLMDVINLPKDFKEKGRMERLAIISNTLLTSTNLLDNPTLLPEFIKETKPSLVSFYNTILKYIRLDDIQKEAIKELTKLKPNWEKVEKARNLMPTMKSKISIVRGKNVSYRDKIKAIEEGALDDYKELEDLKKKGNKRTEEEEIRYRELVNKPLEIARKTKDASMQKSKEPGKFESKGAVLIQRESRMQRYIWTQMNKKGLKHPFVIKRYPTLIQISVNPELPQSIKDKIDLNVARNRAMEEIKKNYMNKYNKWAFDIIDKDSGGHKGITNISGLGVIGLMPKEDRERLKELEVFKKRISDLRVYGRGKLSDEDKEKLKKARAILKKKKITDDERAENEKLEKILMPTMEKIMPEKAKEMKELLDKKEKYAEIRIKMMDDIEIEILKVLKKMFNTSSDIPVMGRDSDVSIPGGTEEFAMD